MKIPSHMCTQYTGMWERCYTSQQSDTKTPALSQCNKFQLFSLSHSDAICDRNKYTVIHHSHYDTVTLWLTVLQYPEAICGRNKYAVVQYTHYITDGLGETFWHIQEVQIVKISTQCYIIPTILLLNHNRLLCQSYELYMIKTSMQQYITARLWQTVLSHRRATTDKNQNTIPIPPVLSYSGKWLNDWKVDKLVKGKHIISTENLFWPITIPRSQTRCQTRVILETVSVLLTSDCDTLL